MRPNEVQQLFEYSWWTSDLLLDKARELTPEQFAAPNALPMGSIRGTFQHIISAHWIWGQRTAFGMSPTALRDFKEFETLEAIRAAYAEQRVVWRDYLAEITEATLDAPTTWKNTRGIEATAPLWQVLSQVNIHSMQHHSEIAQELTVLGHSPGNIDFIYWVIQQNK